MSMVCSSCVCVCHLATIELCNMITVLKEFHCRTSEEEVQLGIINNLLYLIRVERNDKDAISDQEVQPQ